MSTATAERTPTLADIEAAHAETGKLIEAFKARATTTLSLPAFQIELAHGERYAGLVFDENGKPSHHVILLPNKTDDLTWQEAMGWAAKIGGFLPTRQEQSLLFANLKGQFDEFLHWSNAQYSENFAWAQVFDFGYQTSFNKHYEFSARAVRRVAA